jgi:hypothetical protein
LNAAGGVMITASHVSKWMAYVVILVASITHIDIFDFLESQG